MNKIILIGNLTRDPELTETAQGKKLCKFTIAVDRAFDKEKTDFFSCSAWEQKAEVIQKYVKKGNKLGVTGRLEINETEKDGVKTRHHNIIVEEIEFLTPKSEADLIRPNPSEPKLTPLDDTDLPF
ncbi:MAG TPA: single-stranded DNA-binding protein [Paludibacteraceae bacterium]|nr:single-stranded DNA-binding protein [Paludibacteraceae bacterium]